MLATYRPGEQKQALGSARVVSITAPVGGWNTRDSLDQMSATDAVVLDNMIPEIGKVSARKGYGTLLSDMATDLGGTWSNASVDTLIPITIGTNTRLLACLDGGVARVDTGTATQIVADGTYSSDYWSHTVFADSTAPTTPTVIAVNGTDTPWTWDGTTHAAWAPTATAGSFTASDFAFVCSFKNRVYAIESGSRDFWYGSLGAIPGTMTRFPLSGIRGAQGNLLFMAAMTRDTGSGPDDFAVFVTDEGQAIVYAGTDPGTASAWELVGVYDIPRPIPSRRAFVQLFGDLWIATDLDYVRLSTVIQESGALLLTPSKLTGAMTAAADSYRENDGWQMISSPRDNLLISNVPRETGVQYHQHVVNVQTGAPARFTGWNMHCFAVSDGQLYGGGDGAVYRLFSGTTDDVDGTPTAIQVRAQTAWTDLETPVIKHVRATRTLLRTQGMLTFASGIGVDFVDPSFSAAASSGPAGATTLWGDTAGVTTDWGDAAGATTYWAGGSSASTAASREWRLNAGRGTDFCLRLAADVQDQGIEWLSTEYKVTLAGRF